MAQQAKKLEVQITKIARLNYLLHLPRDYAPTKKFPLILFLHGSGERGNELEHIKRTGLPKILETRNDFPFIVVSPQCPAESDWGVLMDDVIALLDHITEHLAVDQSRLYLTGLSMGGRGAYQLAFIAPHRFAALIAISARRPDVLRAPDRAAALKYLPIWIFHGAQDQRTPVSEAQAMERALRECDGNVRLTIYPDVSHDAWTRTYDNPAIYTWLLEHKTNPTQTNTTEHGKNKNPHPI